MVYICSEQSHATIVSAAATKAFVDSMPPGVPVVIDEAYHHYVDDRPMPPIPLAWGKSVVVIHRFPRFMEWQDSAWVMRWAGET